MIEDVAIPHDIREAAQKVSDYAKRQGWGDQWCIGGVSSRATHDAYIDYKTEYNELLSICASICYARIAMNESLVRKGLNELDNYFREENVN